MVTLRLAADRLDSPLPLIREMSKRLALAFSLSINPSKPLLLDDEDQVEDLDNWDDLNLKAVFGSKEVDHQTGSAQNTKVVFGSNQRTMDSNKLLADPAPASRFMFTSWLENR